MTANPYEHEGDNEPTQGEDSTDTTQVADAGIEGQIQYPDREVDAERAAAFAAHKVDSLHPDKPEESGWQNPADRPGEEQVVDQEPGDETGEETEPEGVGGNP